MMSSIPSLKVRLKPDWQFGNKRYIVESLVNEKLAAYLEENPTNGKRIVAKAIEAAGQGMQLAKARELARRKKRPGIIHHCGQAADCQERDPALAEMFMWKETALAVQPQGRDRRYQAILPSGARF
jgi:DNA gyrase subunit B